MSMFKPIPGGSSQKLEFDDQHIEVFLPPVGYVIDRMPDPRTGRPSGKLIKSEILFDHLPLKEKKWRRTQLPAKWEQWMNEETSGKKLDPKFTHREADAFRAQEWKRRINGVWIALGNRHNRPTQYVYLTGLAYFYHTWWNTDFGFPLFRLVYLEIFYLLQFAEDCPSLHGSALSTLRRLGKTAIAYCWLFDYCSRTRFAYGGSQAKVFKDAKEKFKINLVAPWKRLPEFFRPKQYDKLSGYATTLAFTKTSGRGENSADMFLEDTALNSQMDCRETKSTAYDRAKLHRYVPEEPGKWEEANIYETIQKILPCTLELDVIIGKIFCPTTVEELDMGGAEFIAMAEDSMPSQFYKHGRTKSGLLFYFLSATRCYVFDEYGRSVVEDPVEATVGEDGKLIKEGAKTKLLKRRKVCEGDPVAMAIELRQFPWTWSEAKSVANQFCHFNAMKLQKQIDYLERQEKPLWRRFNLDWKGAVDGDVVAVRDDFTGRFQFAWIPDQDADEHEGQTKVLNNVGKEFDDDGKVRFYPLNDRLFVVGTDPIRYDSTDDPRASKAAAYGFRKYDHSIDAHVPVEKWQSNRFMVQYLHRPPDFDVYGEDMIKLCRFLGCGIVSEENVNTLRKHFDMRGYGPFILYRRDFTDDVLNIQKDGTAGDKGVGSQGEVIDTFMNLLNLYFNKHVEKIPFVELLRDALVHRLAKGKTKDSVVGAGFTLLGAKARLREFADSNPEGYSKELDMFRMYAQDGARSALINHKEWKKQVSV